MNLDPDRYREMSKREILRELIEHVATSEEDQEDREHRSGSSTDLNLYLLDNKGFEIGSLDDHINHITQNERSEGEIGSVGRPAQSIPFASSPSMMSSTSASGVS